MPNNKPHTEATKAKMRESHKEVGQRPEVKKARARGAALLWKDPEHREKVIAAQKAGWAARASRIKAQRDAKNAAAVAAHLARMGVNVRAA